MRRIKIAPRDGWQAKAEALGFTWHTIDGQTYWDESAYWRFTSDEVDHLEAVTNEGYQMALEAIGHVIENRHLPLFGYDEDTAALIEKSWEESDALPHLYGRFDLAYDGTQARILEFNADTPTSLYEASVVQWYWLEDQKIDGADQFNSIHDRLVRRMKQIEFANRVKAQGGAGWDPTVHVTCVTPHEEDQGTVAYMEMCAREAGVAVQFTPLTDIGWKEESYNGEVQDGWFVDLDEKRIHTLFKLVPWEWLLADPFGQKLRDEVMNDRLTVIEPAWKMLAANKRLLATMWELNPYHPSLLPTFTTAAPLAGKAYVRKPVWGREGQNVTIFAADGSVAEEVGGAYGDNQYVYQEKAQLMEADGNYAVIGSWLIDGESAGIGIRESTHVITDNMGRFVPHMFA
ncbi:glutathionylspermidine synthase family protein [Caulobacter sp. CCUG 60055]|uniref:glutathionylspermidine synthase family protein n=1 Tax=Caulobacter sp. CCUG 60055 TaxID=2100090 RepID=UPI001FA8007C|nr:glutathionylspermidine synthase family protein [Caulobacter sp. CCUG 60055]